MRCWSCGTVKGKRPCPASTAASLVGQETASGEPGKICTKCCGTKRRVEISCPSDCPYLHGEHDAKWESAEQQNEQVRFFSRFSGIGEEELPFLVFIHYLLLQGGSGLRSVGNTGLLHIVRTAFENFETRSKGIVYEHQSPRMDLQPSAQWLTKALTERDQIPIAPKFSDEQAADVLSKIVDAIESHTEAGEEKSYLDLAEKVFSPLLADAPPLSLPEAPDSGSGLIVPP